MRDGHDGRYPAEGWSGAMEWTGWVPFEELPAVFDPPEGYIVTANNRPVAAPYPYLLGNDFPEPYRARRIVDLLERRTGMTPDDFEAMQRDTISLHARELVPTLLAHARPGTDGERRALDLLRSWTFDSGGSSAEAALFQAWFAQLPPALVADDLGADLLRSYEGRSSYITRFASATLQADDERWCDDSRTLEPETCNDVVTSAFRAALAAVTRQMGTEPAGWRWDSLHRAVFPHQGLDGVGLLKPFLSRTVPGQGDWSTVNVGPVAADRPFEQRSVPSYRQIADLSPADESRFLDAVGQSGHFLSRHYDDFLPDWRSVTYRAMKSPDRGTGDDAARRLRLVPRP